MDGYTLSRQWFDFAFENPDINTSTEGILYMWIVENWNRNGQKEKFGLPTFHSMCACGIKSPNTYHKALKNLISYGFVKIIQESKNQNTSTIITLSAYSKIKSADKSALDSALIRQVSQQVSKPEEHNKQRNKETKKQENNTLVDKSTIQIGFDNFYSLYPKKINRKDAGLKYATALKKGATIDIIEKGLKRSLYFWNSENTEKKYIPAPDVWLNKEKWNDEIKSEVPQNSEDRLLEAKKRLEASPRTPISFN